MSERSHLTDEEIIHRVLEGEKALFEIIVRRFNATLYKVGRAYNYDLEDTKDLMQETFINAYNNLSKFEQRSSFRTWLIRIMLNNCYHKKMKAKRIIAHAIGGEESKYAIKDTCNGTEALVARRELGHIIEDALLKIPYPYRMTFSLREINGLNVAQTAQLLHISETNVKVRLNRAKAMLRKEISKVYVASELFEFNLIHCDQIVETVMKYVNK